MNTQYAGKKVLNIVARWKKIQSEIKQQQEKKKSVHHINTRSRKIMQTIKVHKKVGVVFAFDHTHVEHKLREE